MAVPPPPLPLQLQPQAPLLPAMLVAVPALHRSAAGAVALATLLAVPQAPPTGAAVSVKLALVSLLIVASLPPLAALVLVPVVCPLRRVRVAVLAPLAGAVRRTTIWSPLLTMACCTQAPSPFT